ncbi:hypothetical protein AA13595_2695 [Gluconacetobacter johannae DSM 13595]|uniref:Sulfotransferase family 2 domain-containing protein n=1 Tax=Gluconacetobacter johannae TaxID=112140 RepID=A0A7W4J929_9PROT|nr:sulfotransferase family 2 domain-containing protein [Gluconacetobacter johannae]MBB2176945.1 sulfotransferase family 2 domain-containing protein [Gluconacetobacter johannae]GBQ89638.1 hypothetical protein AA13595_2695 [Gluconacetobacter johannae DSM 13595]
MILSDKREILFIKGMKIGGTSLEVLLARQLDDEAIVTPIIPTPHSPHQPRNYTYNSDTVFYNHIPAAEVRTLIGESRFTSLFKFGIVRHPYEKILSFFFMMRVRQSADYTLDDAIEECSSERTRYCDADGGLLLNTVLRYEKLSVEGPALFSRLGLSFAGFDAIREKGDYRLQYDGPAPELSSAQIIRIERKFDFDLQFYRR